MMIDGIVSLNRLEKAFLSIYTIAKNHSATWTKGRGPRFPGFMEEHVKK